ncbi:MAG: hypothetical protein QOE45_310 [Frankiaceae bacterium]|jgi:hypothetical protein|nr:hypothetical protein [Frankiaceae bacterium]
MPKYVIERAISGAGTLSPAELRGISRTSNAVLAGMSPRVQWQQSYVTDDKIYCVYIADDVDAVLEHARRGGFPADSVAHVSSVIDPTSGD